MPEDKLRGTKFVELTREEAADIVIALNGMARSFRELALDSNSWSYRKANSIDELSERITDACVYPAMNHE